MLNPLVTKIKDNIAIKSGFLVLDTEGARVNIIQSIAV